MSIPKIADFHKFCNALSKTSCAARCPSHLYCRLHPALLIELKRNWPTRQAQIVPHKKLPNPLLSATKKAFPFCEKAFVFIQFSNRIFMQRIAYLCSSYMCVVLSSPMPSMPSTTYFLPLVSVT